MKGRACAGGVGRRRGWVSLCWVSVRPAHLGWGVFCMHVRSAPGWAVRPGGRMRRMSRRQPPRATHGVELKPLRSTMGWCMDRRGVGRSPSRQPPWGCVRLCLRCVCVGSSKPQRPPPPQRPNATVACHMGGQLTPTRLRRGSTPRPPQAPTHTRGLAWAAGSIGLAVEGGSSDRSRRVRSEASEAAGKGRPSTPHPAAARRRSRSRATGNGHGSAAALRLFALFV